MALGWRRVRELRRRNGLSQADLARLSGVGQDTISNLESGRHEPRPSTLRKIAAVFGVEVANLYDEPQRIVRIPGPWL